MALLHNIHSQKHYSNNDVNVPPVDVSKIMTIEDRRAMLVKRRSGTLPLVPILKKPARSDKIGAPPKQTKSPLPFAAQRQQHTHISYNNVVDMLSVGSPNSKGTSAQRRPTTANASFCIDDCPDVNLRRRLNELKAKDLAQRRRIQTLQRAIATRKSAGAHLSQHQRQNRNSSVDLDKSARLVESRKRMKELVAKLKSLKTEIRRKNRDESCDEMETNLQKMQARAVAVKTDFDSTCDKLEKETDEAETRSEMEKKKSALHTSVHEQFHNSLKEVRQRCISASPGPNKLQLANAPALTIENEVRRQCFSLQQAVFALSGAVVERQVHTELKTEVRNSAREIFRLTSRAIKHSKELIEAVPSELLNTCNERVLCVALECKPELGKQMVSNMEENEEILRICVVFSLKAMSNLMRLAGHYSKDSKEDFPQEQLQVPRIENTPLVPNRSEKEQGSDCCCAQTVSTTTSTSATAASTPPSIPPSDKALCDDITISKQAAKLRSRLRRRQSSLNSLKLIQCENEAAISRLRTALSRAGECADAEASVLKAKMVRLERKLGGVREDERRKERILEELREESGQWRRKVLDDARNDEEGAVAAFKCSFRSLSSW